MRPKEQRRVGIYVRVSRDSQDTNMQENEVKEFVSKRGFTLHKVYRDHAESGIKRHRPALDELLADCRKRRFDVLGVWRLDRLARSLPQLLSQSKSVAGIRCVPMSKRCKAELLRWRTRLGPEFSEYVFANPQKPTTHLQNIRGGWPKVLKAAGLEPFWLYDLRHTFASRLTEAGVSPIFVAQIMGHSNANILQTYVRAIDEFLR